jgi:hypothetical protein
MTDPRQQALAFASSWLETAKHRPLRADECMSLVDAVRLVPGLLRPTVQTLSIQRDAAAVDALLAVPGQVPGVVEGLFGAFSHGITRHRFDGSAGVAMLALDFRRGKSPLFAEVVERAHHVFGDGFVLLDVEGVLHHRVALDARRGTLGGRAAAIAHDVTWLHAKLSRLKGTRLWLNGWCFADAGPLKPAAQIHLVRAWLGWAARQLATAAR